MNKKLWLVLISIVSLAGFVRAERVRPAAVAGQFYPENAAELQTAVEQLLSQAPAHKIDGKIIGILVPHAGYIYSGAVAAEGIKAAGTGWTTVVLMGSGHRASPRAAAVYSHGFFETPLGKVPVDESITSELLKSPSLFQDQPEAHSGEHSLEVEIPFLQRTLKDFKIVPILLNTQDSMTAKKAGAALANAVRGKKALLLFSSDLSHYPPGEDADLIDKTFLKGLERMDPEYLWMTSAVLLGHGEKSLVTAACGQPALAAGLFAMRSLGADEAILLRYANSGDTPEIGDPKRAVGYAAVVFVDSGKSAKTAFDLTEASKTRLLEDARDAISSGVNGESYSKKLLAGDPQLNLPAAVFVTLTKNGNLRGCIGTTSPQAGLLESVRYFAQAAAFEDHRFKPVEKSELDGLHIEISILSTPQPVKNADAVIPKKHGVIVRKGNRSGLFLPSVWEQLPDKTEFLSEVCSQKAGLPADCWKDPSVEILVFTTDGFEEPRR